MTDPFTVVADPTRRRILAVLAQGDHSVGDLVSELDLPQPMVSKHLKVLRENGFVTSEASAQHRIYRLEPQPFSELETWLAQFLSWNRSLGRLETHLDHIDPPKRKEKP